MKSAPLTTNKSTHFFGAGAAGAEYDADVPREAEDTELVAIDDGSEEDDFELANDDDGMDELPKPVGAAPETFDVCLASCSSRAFRLASSFASRSLF